MSKKILDDAGVTELVNSIASSVASKYATKTNATTSTAGLMSASDKSKLDSIAAGANAYTHPTYTSRTNGLYKVTVDGTGHVTAATEVAKADITALGIPAQDTTYSEATTSAAGLMSAADKTKLDGLTNSTGGSSKIDILTEDPSDPEDGYCWIKI